MSSRHPVTTASTLAPGKMQCFDVNGKKIILYNVAGEFFATDAMCSHEDFPLWYGALKGYYIECSLHSSCFDVRNGQPTEEPATDPIATYQTEVLDDTVFVIME